MHIAMLRRIVSSHNMWSLISLHTVTSLHDAKNSSVTGGRAWNDISLIFCHDFGYFDRT